MLDYKGTLRGRIPQTLGIFTTTFEFNITAQTLTSVTGKATIDGLGANGKMKGKLLSNGNFVYRFAARGVIFGITGHVRPDGQVITGTASLQVLVGSRTRITGKLRRQSGECHSSDGRKPSRIKLPAHAQIRC